MIIIKCKKCGEEKQHSARGYCESCYHYIRAKERGFYTPTNKRAIRKWQKKNRLKWNEYMKLWSRRKREKLREAKL